MKDLSAQRLEAERDRIVSLLRAIADQLSALAGSQAREPLRHLRAPVTSLAAAAAPVLGPLPSPATADAADPAGWPTVVFVRRGTELDS